MELKLPMELKLFNKKSKKPGTLILESIDFFQKPTFLDYLRGGLELNLSIAIDFTASNGSPKSPNSLHFMDPFKPNQYQTVIDSVSRILLNYDSDKQIPSFGFGGKPSYPTFSTAGVNHCFPLSGDFKNVNSFGLEHLMELYKYALQHVQLSGPTLFMPILQEAFKIANTSKMEGSRCYQILLILTDGEIHDMENTVDLIVRSCHLPISIIIVGVGDADFGKMVRLDGDQGLYNSKNQKAQRDIVQFVPFRQVNMNSELLAKELLEELPQQVVEYMVKLGIFRKSRK